MLEVFNLAGGPIAFLLIAVLCIGFESLIFGQELIESSIYVTLSYGDCQAGSPLENVGCVILNVFKIIANVLIVFASVIRFFFNALTFNIPGAPLLARVLVGTFFIGGVGWSIANLLRGTKA
jgi:hypothetical protein